MFETPAVQTAPAPQLTADQAKILEAYKQVSIQMTSPHNREEFAKFSVKPDVIFGVSSGYAFGSADSGIERFGMKVDSPDPTRRPSMYSEGIDSRSITVEGNTARVPWSVFDAANRPSIAGYYEFQRSLRGGFVPSALVVTFENGVPVTDERGNPAEKRIPIMKAVKPGTRVAE
ncbi:MAG: hypothetical protein IT290_11935 [Deltaproteobacteria bacterium]|nr:hypothetical protein [Deltaproteobacteria bacterium]